MAFSIHLEHAYPSFNLAVDLSLPMRGVSAIYGPSGSGKTTLLRLVAGLERAARGRVVLGDPVLGDTVWQDEARFVPTHQRALGYVFQDARLFPHLTVRANLAYGQRRARSSARLDDVVELLQIAPLLARSPDRLSGGEAQRVAIARALLTQPALLLMDEPLSALDAIHKAEILPYLERLHRSLDIPVLYVSHQMDEIARLADHLVMMQAGQVVAEGPLTTLLTRLDLPIAHRLDAEAVIAATVVAHDTTYHLTTVAFAGGHLELPYHPVAAGQSVRIRVRARDVSLTLAAQTGTSILNILPATVRDMAFDGDAQVMVGLALGDATHETDAVRVLARITRKSADLLSIVPGRQVYAQIKGVAIVE
jgi:molybdate transport system ATP-binding protein